MSKLRALRSPLLTRVDLAIKTPPLRGELDAGLDVFNRDGEVNEVEVEVIKTPEVQGVFGGSLNLSGHVRGQSAETGARAFVDLRAPLRGWCSTAGFPGNQLPLSNRISREQTLEVIPSVMSAICSQNGRIWTLTEILALHETILDGTSHALTSLLLVAVVGGTVEQAVTGLDRVVDGLKPKINTRRTRAQMSCSTYVGASLFGDLQGGFISYMRAYMNRETYLPETKARRG